MITPEELYEWCRIPYQELENHPGLKVPFRLVKGSEQMGQMIAGELVDLIQRNNDQNRETRAIIPCGPSCWYKPFTSMVNSRKVDLKNFVVFHMDDCLDWQGRLLPKNHPYNFRTVMEKMFYSPVDPGLSVPDDNRNWLCPDNIGEIKEKISTEFQGRLLKEKDGDIFWEMPVEGLFVAIGHTPATSIFKDVITLDEWNYVKKVEHKHVGNEVDPFTTSTSIKGVFVAGDVHDYHYRQAVTAAGFGCMAGMDVLKHLDKPVQSW